MGESDTNMKQLRLSLSGAAAPSPQAGARSHSWPLIVQSTTSSSSISCSKERKVDISASMVPFPFSLGISRTTWSKSLLQAQVLRYSSSPAPQDDSSFLVVVTWNAGTIKQTSFPSSKHQTRYCHDDHHCHHHQS